MHIIHGDVALGRYDAANKFNTTFWFAHKLFALGPAKAREWRARRLPVIPANRADGLAAPMFEPMSDLSGRSQAQDRFSGSSGGQLGCPAAPRPLRLDQSASR